MEAVGAHCCVLHMLVCGSPSGGALRGLHTHRKTVSPHLTVAGSGIKLAVRATVRFLG